MENQEKETQAPVPEWDRQAVFDEHIGPLLETLLERCKEHGIPILAIAQFALDNERGAGISTTRHVPPSLSDEQIYWRMRSIFFASVLLSADDASGDVSTESPSNG